MVLSFFIGGVFLSFFSLYFPFLSLSLFIILSFFLLRKRKFLAILFLAIGFIYSFLRQDIEPKGIPDIIRAQAVFSSPERSLIGNYKYRLYIKDCSSNSCPAEVRLYLDKYLEPGTEAEILMKLKQRSYGLVPGIYSKPYYIATPLDIKIKEVSGNIRWTVEKERLKLNQLFDRIFNKKTAQLSKALVTGSKDVDPELRESFRKAGLAHLLTISGTHFGLLFFLFFKIINRIILFLPYRFFHRLTTYVSIDLISGILVLPILIWYFIVSGMEIPAFRSFIMAVLFIFGLMNGRRYYWLSGLLIAATIILIIEPASLFELSFLLSFSAVLFIGLWLESSKKVVKDGEVQKIRLKKLFMNSLVICLSATLGTLPLVLYFFHYLPLTGILSNIIVTPLVCFIVLPLLLFFSFIYLLTGEFFIKDVLEVSQSLIIKIIELFSSFKYSEITTLPFPLIILPLLYLLLFLFLVIKNRFKYLYLTCFIFIIAFLAIRTERVPQITFLDVGQGDSSIIELPDGKVIVIDTGRDGIETSAYLRYRAKRSIDVLILSHPHPDHTGGLRLLKENFTIKEIWDNGLLIYPEDFRDIPRRSLKRGDHISFNGYDFIVFHPYKGFQTSEDRYSYENNSSLVIKVSINGTSALFPGDIEKEAEEDMVYLGKILDSDILKIPHHGSRYSFYEKFFDLVSPSISIISAGEGNPYGHPHEEILMNLRNSKVFITFASGSVKILFGDRLYVKISKDFILRKTRSPDVEVLNIRNLLRTF